MPVQGTRCDIECLGYAPHRQIGQSVGGKDRQGGVKDEVSVELHEVQGSLQDMSYRRIAALAACALPLTLAACGAGDDGDAAQDTTTQAAAEQPQSEQPADAEAADAGAALAKDNNPQAPADEPAPQDDKPIDGGIASSQDSDQDQISQLVYGLGGKSFVEMNRFLFDNSCRAYIDGAGGREFLDKQNAELARMDPSGELDSTVPVIHSVDNIAIEGDNATAQVTRTANGKREANNMVFLKEDGRWTICGSNPGQ